MKVVKVGVMETDAIESAKPAAELYAAGRISWQPEAPEAKQLQGMK